MVEKLRLLQLLSLIMVSGFSIVMTDPVGVLAATPSAGIKQAIGAAVDILPITDGKRMVSLCPDARFTPASLDIVRKLAENGNAIAECSLGIAYRVGLKTPQYGHPHPDDPNAMIWFRKSADQGDSVAQSELGDMYEHGDGVKQDFVEASQWYRRAAAQGDAWSQFRIAESYRNGSGVAQNDAEALKWYRKAAAQGMPLAALFLSDAYRSGTHGLAKDDVQAYMWMIIRDRVSQAIWAGQRDATDKKYLERYEEGMTTEQITKAKRLADSWKPQHEQPYLAESLDEFNAK